MAAHLFTSWVQDELRMLEMVVLDLRAWKKALEFSRRSETAWQSVIVLLARHAL